MICLQVHIAPVFCHWRFLHKPSSQRARTNKICSWCEAKALQRGLRFSSLIIRLSKSPSEVIRKARSQKNFIKVNVICKKSAEARQRKSDISLLSCFHHRSLLDFSLFMSTVQSWGQLWEDAEVISELFRFLHKRRKQKRGWQWKSQRLKKTQHQYHPVTCRHLWKQFKLVYMEKIKENKQLQLDSVLPTAVLENTLTEHQQTAEEHFLFLWETPETSVKSPSASVIQQDRLWEEAVGVWSVWWEARSWRREPAGSSQIKKQSSLCTKQKSVIWTEAAALVFHASWEQMEFRFSTRRVFRDEVAPRRFTDT